MDQQRHDTLGSVVEWYAANGFANPADPDSFWDGFETACSPKDFRRYNRLAQAGDLEGAYRYLFADTAVARATAVGLFPGALALPLLVDRLERAARAASGRPGVIRRILDVGCAAGATTCALAATHPASTVTGIDPLAQATRTATALATELALNNAAFRQASIDELASDNSEAPGGYDLVLSSMVAHEADDRYATGLASALADGGTLVSLERLATFHETLAWVEALTDAGLHVDLDRSCLLVARTAAVDELERFPCFVATRQASPLAAPVTAERLADWHATADYVTTLARPLPLAQLRDHYSWVDEEEHDQYSLEPAAAAWELTVG